MAHVKIYTSPTCIFCKKTKEFLKTRSIDYEEYDVSKDAEKAHEMIERTGQMAVPVIDIEGKMVIGYNPKALSKALENV